MTLEAELIGAKFCNCDLEGACFAGTDLTNVDFENAILTNVDFSFCNLSKAKNLNLESLKSLDLSKTKLSISMANLLGMPQNGYEDPIEKSKEITTTPSSSTTSVDSLSFHIKNGEIRTSQSSKKEKEKVLEKELTDSLLNMNIVIFVLGFILINFYYYSSQKFENKE